MKDTSHAEQYTVMIISRSVLLRMRTVSDKSCRENQTTRFMLRNLISENRAVYDITWESIVQPGRPRLINCACALHTG